MLMGWKFPVILRIVSRWLEVYSTKVSSDFETSLLWLYNKFHCSKFVQILFELFYEWSSTVIDGGSSLQDSSVVEVQTVKTCP